MKKDGGYAFPQKTISHHRSTKEGIEPVYETTGGLSVRDYFAGQALSGLSVPPIRVNDIDWIANMSYRLADAMLAEREKEQ